MSFMLRSGPAVASAAGRAAVLAGDDAALAAVEGVESTGAALGAAPASAAASEALGAVDVAGADGEAVCVPPHAASDARANVREAASEPEILFMRRTLRRFFANPNWQGREEERARGPKERPTCGFACCFPVLR